MTQDEDAIRDHKIATVMSRYQESARLRDKASRDGAQAIRDAKWQVKEDMARRLLAMGLAVDQISEATELTPEEIESLG